MDFNRGRTRSWFETDLQERLDLLHLELVASTRENVCTNERCPHYKKSCKMR
jgi:hypothetical protein